IRDIMNIAKRRNPYVQLILCPALVQGEGAAASIVRGIETLDAMGLDVLIVGRGGGSIEDLWAFNEEAVARAIFACRTPVISAVGHETDVTIADYVADLRAPTPSAAAELAVFDYTLFEEQLEAVRQQLFRSLHRKEEQVMYRLRQYELTLKLHDPMRQLNEKRQRLADAQLRMQQLTERKLTDRKHRLALLGGRLDGLSPLKKISGGFGFMTDEGGKRIESVADVSAGDSMLVRVSDGRIETRVVKTEKFES
ncbi:MAG: exodeoxyribonuclease VII large subunit, partial [Clostridium sp.]|nr:exodeoxyribonuclease VII large subunit [Clostridium sp.]